MCVNTKKIVPIVFSVDENYLPILAVSLMSILENGSKDVFYKFYVFHTSVKENEIEKMKNFNTNNSQIIFVNVNDKMKKLFNKLCVRDNYNDTIYYRFFIPELLSEYEKVIYLDCDTIIKSDIAHLYDIDLGKNILGAVSDEAVNSVDVFSEYTTKYLGIKKGRYFNSGVLLINVKEYNKNFYDKKLLKLIDYVKFEVAPDQDYLNVLFHDRITYLDVAWNKMPINDDLKKENIKIIHYNLNYKPWYFDGILYGEYFWEIAKRTKFYNFIKNIKSSYGEKEKRVSENNLKNLISIIGDCLSKKSVPFTQRSIF